MLFEQCQTRQEKDVVETVLFQFLDEKLRLKFRPNKQRTLFAHFCGFPTYNHAKPAFDALPSESNPRSFVDLVWSVRKETGNREAVKNHLFRFLEKHLSLTFNSDAARMDLFAAMMGIGRRLEGKEEKLTYDVTDAPIDRFVSDHNGLTWQTSLLRNFEGKKVADPLLLSSGKSPVVLLGDGEFPNVGELLKTSKHVVSVNSSLNMGLPQLQMTSLYALRSPLVDKLVIVCPASLMMNYKRTLAEQCNIHDVKVISSGVDFNGFENKVTIMSVHLFSKIEFDDKVAKGVMVLHEDYCNPAPATKTHKGIRRNIKCFEMSLTLIDSLPTLIDSLNVKERLLASDREALISDVRRQIEANYF